MKINLSNDKTVIAGIQDSGKTYVAKKLILQFKKPLVYAVHGYEWVDAPDKIDVFIPKDYKLETFNEFCKKLISNIKGMDSYGKDKKTKTYDALFIDEFDYFFSNNIDITQYDWINDLFINHAHYRIALVGITRRVQDIPTKFFESSRHRFIFAVEGENAERKIIGMHPDMKELMPQLTVENHWFVYHRIGHAPQLIKEVETIKKQEVKNGVGKNKKSR